MVKPVTMIGYWHWFAINHVDFWNITSQVSRIHNLTVLFGPKFKSYQKISHEPFILPVCL